MFQLGAENRMAALICNNSYCQFLFKYLLLSLYIIRREIS